jgi:hypothetical protein
VLESATASKLIFGHVRDNDSSLVSKHVNEYFFYHKIIMTVMSNFFIFLFSPINTCKFVGLKN